MNVTQLRKRIATIAKQQLHLTEADEEQVSTEPDAQLSQDSTSTEPDVSDVQPSNDNDKDSVYSPDNMVKLFNVIRSGQSMKDENVMSKLNTWWDKTESSERNTFLMKLAHVAKIVTSEKDESDDKEQVDEPESEPRQSQPAQDVSPKQVALPPTEEPQNNQQSNVDLL